MIDCVFYLMIVGISPADDTPKDIEVYDCRSELRFKLQDKEVYIYDKLTDDELYIYQEIEQKGKM